MTDQNICKIEGCDNPSRHLGWCRAHYRRFNRYGDPLAGASHHYADPDHAFLARQRRNDATGCIEWIGACDQKGYGQLRINGKLVKAHRYSWARVNGPIPEGHLIRHKCDNPKCVNADHLEVGTYTDNVADMDQRGRRVNAQPKGSMNGNAKITEMDVIAIRADARRQVDIAKDYGISQAVVSKIKLRQAWEHVA